MLDEVGFAGVIADQAARFGNQQRTRCHVPGLQASFKKAVGQAGGDVGQVQRRSAGATHARALAHHFAEHVQVRLELVAGTVRKAGRNQAVLQARALADADAAVVDVSATAFAGAVNIVANRVINDGLLDLAAHRQGDTDAVKRKAVDEIGRAVQRVDDPDEFGIFRAMLAARLFGQNAVAGVSRQQRFNDRGFGGLIDFGDEVVGLLERDANGLNIKGSAVDEGAGGARSLDGHVEHGVEIAGHIELRKSGQELRKPVTGGRRQ